MLRRKGLRSVLQVQPKTCRDIQDLSLDALLILRNLWVNVTIIATDALPIHHLIRLSETMWLLPCSTNSTADYRTKLEKSRWRSSTAQILHWRVDYVHFVPWMKPFAHRVIIRKMVVVVVVVVVETVNMDNIFAMSSIWPDPDRNPRRARNGRWNRFQVAKLLSTPVALSAARSPRWQGEVIRRSRNRIRTTVLEGARNDHVSLNTAIVVQIAVEAKRKRESSLYFC